jgi:hypothetical protein
VCGSVLSANVHVLCVCLCFEQVVEIQDKNYSTTPFVFQKVAEKVTYGCTGCD